MKISRFTTLGEIAGAAISPDAKYVAYALDEAAGESLWIRQVATPNGMRILAPAAGDISSLTFSPDGKQFAFVLVNPAASEAALMAANADGTGYARWRFGGGRNIFHATVCPGCRMGVRSPALRGARRTTAGRRFTWSGCELRMEPKLTIYPRPGRGPARS
jgi:dipeptidyl aminopeptidase/acylaminoacyl peptidase